MKKTLGILAAAAFCAAPAFAADLPVKAPVYKAAPASFNWTGCYIGLNTGGVWGKSDSTLEGFRFNSANSNEWAGGGQIGCDIQSTAWVFGVAGSFDWTSGDRARMTDPFNPLFFIDDENQWLAAVTGRIGFAVDRSLFYAKGGGAWRKSKFALKHSVFGTAFTKEPTISGWTVGGGWEYAFAPNWSVMVEYDYYRFSDHFTSVCAFGCSFTPEPWSSKATFNEVLVGINYRFGSR